MTQEQIVKKLTEIRPNAQWAIRGNTYDSLEWLDPTQVKPTEAELGL